MKCLSAYIALSFKKSGRCDIWEWSLFITLYVRFLQSRYRQQFKQQKPDKDTEPKRKEESDNDDNWDFYEVDLPYNLCEMIFIHLY